MDGAQVHALLTRLSDTESQLRGMGTKLSLVDPPATPLNAARAVHTLEDVRYEGYERLPKSVRDPRAQDRTASELYPIPNPPAPDFIFGEPSKTNAKKAVVRYN